MDASKLHTKLDLYQKTGTRTKLGGTEKVYQKVKRINVEMIPQSLTGSDANTVAGTEVQKVTHRIRCRKKSIKNLTSDTYFVDLDNVRYNILYFQRDYKNNDFWEIMLQVKTE